MAEMRWHLAAAPVALLTGVLLAWQPLAAVALVALVGVGLVLRRPELALHLLLVSEGTMFLSRMVLGSYTLPTAAAFGACLVALGALTLRDRRRRAAKVYLGALLVLLPWALYGAASYGAGQAIAGVRLTSLPLLAVALGLSLDRAAFGRLLRTAALLLAANAVAAAWERSIGVQGLLARGVSYGDQITEISADVLRAPGLMRNSFHLGLFSGAFLAVVALSVFVAEQRLGRVVLLVGVPSAMACLLLSTSRTSMVAAVVAALLCVQMSDSGTRLGRASRVAAALTLPALPVGVALVGAGSADSMLERLTVWSRFLSSGLNLLGNGVGSVGAATFSPGAETGRVFVDNYWLSIAHQFGGLVLVALYAGFVVLLVAVLGRRVRRRASRALAAVVITLAAASMFLEVWEYPGCMALFGSAFGHWWAQRATERAGSQPQETDSTIEAAAAGLRSNDHAARFAGVQGGRA